MKLSNIKIGSRLGLGFSLIILFSLGMSIFSYLQLQNISKDTSDLYYHPFTVSNAVRDLQIKILSMASAVKNGVHSNDIIEINNEFAAADEYEKEILTLFQLIEQRFLGDKQDVKTVYDNFIKWNLYRQETVSIKKNANSELALKRLLGEGKIIRDQLDSSIFVLVNFASNKAKEFYSNSISKKDNSEFWLITFFSITFILGIVLSILITFSITKPLYNLVKTIEDFSAGKFASKIYYEAEDELGVLSDSLRMMQKDLLEKAEVAQAIAVGDFSKMTIWE